MNGITIECSHDSDGPELTKLLCNFLNEQWKKELGMKMTINISHPDAEMDSYRTHETNMSLYRQLFTIVQRAEEHSRVCERLLVLAKKHCPRAHYDWDEIMQIADDAQ